MPAGPRSHIPSEGADGAPAHSTGVFSSNRASPPTRPPLQSWIAPGKGLRRPRGFFSLLSLVTGFGSSQGGLQWVTNRLLPDVV